MTPQPKLVLDASQEAAVQLACTAPVGIVTGGPGTGKSTCLREVLDRLDKHKVTYELASPTGKAAKRLNETTGRPARTIHRLLEFHPSRGFQRNRDCPLDCDVVLVDESSMIDVELGAALLRAIRPHTTRLILIGDADQLPPVGPGRLFGDLVDAKATPMVRLDTLHRSALESWIHVSASNMLHGRMPDLEPRPDFRFAECHDPAWILPKLKRLYTDVFPAKIDATAQVLIPQRPGVAGIDAANTLLQETLNPRRPSDPFVPHKGWELRLGDRVIQTRNDYKLEVFNGEVGDVLDISPSAIIVRFPGHDQPLEYTHEQARGLQLAYALTVHRSQGSEFPWVICVVHSTHSHILTRQLVYTAITRAKQGVVLVGDMKGLRYALSGRKPERRNTTLIERLRGALEPTQDA